MHEPHSTRPAPDDVRLEDVVPADLLDDAAVDREYLEKVLRSPQNFLPAPRTDEAPPADPEPEQPESRLARRAKLIGLLGAATLLSAAVVTAALADSELVNPPGHAHHNAQPPEITGVAALGGFASPGAGEVLPHDHDHPHDTTATTSQTGTLPAGAGEKPGGTPAQTEIAGSTSGTTGTTPGSTGMTSAYSTNPVELVERFYELVDRSPTEALGMLATSLIGGQTGELVRSWSAMESVRVEDVTTQADGVVRAVVTLVQPDGRHLRIVQLLRFSESRPGTIIDARLLSAQHVS
ncbi:hypothetical protein [Amycolatopsis suaedae]|uniref:Uncharacterized protein n=1 Tax=Amycolatopsis suaedae TaxID=2510978 RepID=A0A4Q7JAM6_9PSEU|nr:hypothetical protein [Amycolatopsis suaedae]RZQ64026.1 hypothetical protein EWH70_08455 [Amycolatopsis suaedae]